ncbi:4520_t:CDS:2 [Paraglomus brasilianum]|uniref:4520_t:CDS:1 n=1 Tax=Paraglomus brasilianum TaxID=144538 RepID=A0A9N8VKE7_9GLOM|nr:4520_t:CDS:2 [Paraglomus brasilianum]
MGLSSVVSRCYRQLPRCLPIGRRFFATSATLPPRNYAQITPPYETLVSNLSVISKTILGSKPLTQAEKILYAHIWDPYEVNSIVRGETYLKLRPDRVAMQDASAQMAILQFMLSGMSTTAVPTSIHCDHLIEAYEGANSDVKAAEITNKEIFDFLQSAAEKYGMSFWRPGSGIIHQIVLENYAAPGGLMLGTGNRKDRLNGKTEI